MKNNTKNLLILVLLFTGFFNKAYSSNDSEINKYVKLYKEDFANVKNLKFVSEKLIEFGKKKSIDSLSHFGYNGLAAYFNNYGDNVSAIKNFENAIKFISLKSNINEVVYTYYCLSGCYFNIKYFNYASKYLKSLKEILRKSNSTEFVEIYKFRTLVLESQIAIETGSLNLAFNIINELKSSKYCQIIKNDKTKTNEYLFYDLQMMYFAFKNESEGYLKVAFDYLRFSETDPEPQTKCLALFRLVHYYTYINLDLDSSLTYLNEIKKLGYNNSLSFQLKTYEDLAYLYKNINNDSTLKYSLLQYNESDTSNFLIHKINACNNLSDIYNAIKDYKNAYKYSSEFSSLQEKLRQKDKSDEINIINLINEIGQNETKTEKIKADNKLAKFKLYLFVLLILFISLVLLYVNLKQKRSLTLSELKALRSQLNPHYLSNSLQSVQNLILNNKKEDAIEIIGMYGKVMRSILNNSEKQFIPILNEIQTLQLYIELENMRLGNKCDFFIDSSNISDDVLNKLTVPSMLIQPFVENAIIHGLQNKKNGNKELIIKFDFIKNKKLLCEVLDNGVGRTKNNETNTRKSFGIKNIKDRFLYYSKLLNIHTEVKIIDLFDEDNNPSGTKVILHLPFKLEK